MILWYDVIWIYIVIYISVDLLYQCLIWTFSRWYFFWPYRTRVTFDAALKPGVFFGFLNMVVIPFSPSVRAKFVVRKNRKKLGESMKSWWQNVFRNYLPPIIRRSLRCCILRRWQLQLHPSFCHLYRVDLDLLNVETLGTKGSTVVFVHRFEKR